MKTAFRSRLGRTVAAALVVAASVLGPSWVAADGLPDDPLPKPPTMPDLDPAEVVVGVVTTGFLMLDATTF